MLLFYGRPRKLSQYVAMFWNSLFAPELMGSRDAGNNSGEERRNVQSLAVGEDGVITSRLVNY